MAKIAYAPFGLATGMLSGLLAGAIFKQLWKRMSGEEDAPGPQQGEYGWREILLASALQGAIFAFVKALVARGGARGFERLTGVWPGD